MLGVILVILYLALVLLGPGITLIFGFPGELGFTFELGRALALSAFCIVALQPVLISRIKWIERQFGLDILSRFHRIMGLTALVLLLPHPALLAFGGAGTSLLLSLDLPWYVLVGKATLVFLIIQAVLGIYWERLGLTFEKWRKSHCVLAPVILILGFIHSWYAGDDLEHVELQIYWVIILLIGVIPFVWHKFIKPRTLSEYTVTDVKQESHNVWTIKLKPPEGETIYDYLPGQFHFLTLRRDPSLPVEEHHWTISSSPENRDYLSSTIKESGDFTSTIGSTKPGDRALVDGAYGRFSYTLHDHEDERVFIAGGIGITPFMSMLRHMRDTRVQKRVILIYANRGQDDLVFRSQLDEIAQGQYPDLKIVYVLSEPDPDWQGETGYVTGDLIKRHCPDDLASKHFYICGPPVMSEMVVNALQGMGVSTDRIRTERFSL